MTQDQFMSILRGFFNIAGGALVSHGVISGGDVSTISGIAMGIAGLAWGAFVHTDDQIVKAAVNVAAKNTIK